MSHSSLKSLMLSFWVVLGLVGCHCNEETIPPVTNAAGVVTSLPNLWKKLLHPNKDAPNPNIFVKSGTTYNNGVLLPTTTSPNSRFFTLTDIDDGTTIWSWDNTKLYFQADALEIPYQKDSWLTMQRSKNTVCLDLETGTPHWEKIRERYMYYPVTGIGNTFFLIGEPTDTLLNTKLSRIPYICYSGNVLTGDIRRCFVPNFSSAVMDSGMAAAVAHVVPVLATNGDTLLSCTYGESFKEWNPYTYLSLYNLTKKTWVYDRVLMADPTSDTSPDWMRVENGRVYVSVGGYVCCHDLDTGKRLWRTYLPNNLLFSGFIVTEKLVVANCEDTWLYGLDIATGKQVWKEQSNGTSSPLQAMNGVVYYTGGGFFHAVEIATGKHLWKLTSPDGSNFFAGPYMIPATGGHKPRVVARTALYAYCYEAAR